MPLRKSWLIIAAACLASAGCGSSTAPSVSPTAAGAASATPSTAPPTGAPPTRMAVKTRPTATASSAGAATPGQPAQAYVLAAELLDTAHAAALVKDCDASGSCDFRVDTSSDGGQTWQRGASLPVTAKTGSDNPVDGLAMLDPRTLYAYGASLWRSTDAGSSWQQVAGAPTISAVFAAAGSVWAGPACVDLAHCSSSLDVVAPTGLTPLPEQPPGEVRDVVRAGDHAYVLAQVSDAHSALAVSTDAGKTWRQHPLPAQACGFALGRPLAVAPDGTLYVVCAGGAGAGNEPKRLYRSTDGGGSWHDVGALETYGYADSMDAPTPTLLWRYGARAPVYASTDAGHSWQAQLSNKIGDAAGPSVQAFAAAGNRALAFAFDTQPRPDNGWSINEYLTTDAGRTWRTLPFTP
jgi:photosystem II stability/assembly factor-like uncharacterized protein